MAPNNRCGIRTPKNSTSRSLESGRTPQWEGFCASRPRARWRFETRRGRSAKGPGCVETAWDFGVGDSALVEAALESRNLGLRGCGDASVHRWRRSDATDAATKEPGRFCQRGEPGSGGRGLHRRTGPCRLGIFRDDAGGDGTAGLPSLDAAEDLPLRLSQPPAVEPAARTGSAAQYRVDVVGQAARP